MKTSLTIFALFILGAIGAQAQSPAFAAYASYQYFMDCFLSVDQCVADRGTEPIVRAVGGTECRGRAVHIVQDGLDFWWLRVYSNSAYGETVGLQLDVDGESWLNRGFEFVSQGFVGWVDAPVEVAFVRRHRCDVNGDGEVSVADVVRIVNVALDDLASPEVVALCDVNGDGEVTVADVVITVNVALEWP